MPFLSLFSSGFRNIKDTTVDMLSHEVFFIGENGQGKSNMLEALYYTAYGSSFRTHTDADIVRHGEKDFSLKALFCNEDEYTHTIQILFQGGKKNIIKNGKHISDRKEMINTIPCVLFCHSDLDFAVGEPERRRFFIDQSLSMYDDMYINMLRQYRKVLKSRNQLLKDNQYDMLDIFDIHLSQHGLHIQRKRENALLIFNTIFTELYEKITGIDEVRIAYEPSWKKSFTDESESDINEYILNQLKAKRPVDISMGVTMSGPHRDKIRFMRKSRPFIPSASTGQRRLIAVILRIAQAIYYTKITEKKPVLLMDDVLLELDPEKRQKVIQHLPAYNQLFCTFLPGEPYENYKTAETRIYYIKDGSLYE